MKFKIADKILYRVPHFPLDATLKECWDELKNSIALSSTDFYQEIASTNYEQLQSLSRKSRQTILKYFNRSKYRPVPFGAFAAVGLIDPKPDDFSKIILLNHIQFENHFIDWPLKDEVSYQFENVVNDNCFVFTNSTYYVIADKMRYVYKNEGGFELADIEHNSHILRILKFCFKPVRLAEIVDSLSMHFEKKDECILMVKELILEQLLFTSKDPNIIGEDYFQRIGFKQNLLPPYVIAERKYLAGSIDKKLLRYLPSLLDLLLRLSGPAKVPQNLKSFKDQFAKRFDRMEVPIMQVLDPEIGIGYGQLESASNSDSITDFLPNGTNLPQQEISSWKNLVSSQLSNGKNRFIIFLDQLFNINEIALNDCKVANTVSAFLQVADDYIILNHLGGYSTNQFAGRFSLASEEIYNYCKETAGFEQESNPDILFFDVGYTAERKVDNVNRRRQIYGLQLSILNYDTSDNPLTLDDLMVSIRNNEVILRSKRLNKRLVPRMATAYNHNRSDLPVYRFLCDLNVQSITTNLSLPLTEIVPGLSYYPRVQYHNIVVSPAIWTLSGKDYKKYNVADDDKLRSFLSFKGVSGCVKLGIADQTLLLDLSKQDDIDLIEMQLMSDSDFFLEEAFLPVSSIFKDQNGRPFLSQLIVTLRHNNTIYNGYNFKELPTNINRLFAPGSEWLYFEIFCHPNRSDELLIKLHIQLFLKHSAEIRKWFFIRYNENGEHLRVRLQLLEPAYSGVIMKSICILLEDELISGLVSDLQIKAYKREIERYGEQLMDKIEDYFYEDSLFVLGVIFNETDNFIKYNISIILFNRIAKLGMFQSEELFNWLSGVYNSFAQEHGLTSASFKKLNKFIREIPTTKNGGNHVKFMEDLCRLGERLENMLNECQPDQRLRLFTDLMHMHINRMFSQHQRTHELVIYEMLLSSIKRNRAKSNHHLV